MEANRVNLFQCKCNHHQSISHLFYVHAVTATAFYGKNSEYKSNPESRSSLFSMIFGVKNSRLIIGKIRYGSMHNDNMQYRNAM